jgi:hypothetical protein
MRKIRTTRAPAKKIETEQHQTFPMQINGSHLSQDVYNVKLGKFLEKY